MNNKRRGRKPHEKRERRISLKADWRDSPDVSKLGRAIISLALAQAEAEAQEENKNSTQAGKKSDDDLSRNADD